MPTEAGMGGRGLTSIDLAEYFYANDFLVGLKRPEKHQRAFDVLNGFFDRVGLWTNTARTVGIVCLTCHAHDGKLEEA